MALYRVSPTLATKSGVISSARAAHTNIGPSDPANHGLFVEFSVNGSARTMRRERIGSPVELNASEVDALTNVGYNVVAVEPDA